MSNCFPKTKLHWSAVGVWAAIVLVSMWAAATPFGASFQDRLDSWHWQWGSEIRPDSRFLIVDVDERSLSLQGPWPWRRDKIAALVRSIQEAGASEVTLDMMFPHLKVGDAVLNEAFQVHPRPIVAHTFALPGNEEITTGVIGDGFSEDLCRHGLFPEAVGYVGNAPSLDVEAGHIVPKIDSDGILRETPAFVCYDNKPFPALALKAFFSASGLGDSVRLGSTSALQRSLLIDDELVVPLSESGGMVIPYHRESSSFERVSASDVMSGIIDLEGRWVVLGSSAVGLSDRVATPLSPLESGAFAHLRLLGALLDQEFPTESWVADAIVWIVSAFAAGLLLFLGVLRYLRWWAVPTVLTVGVGLFFVVAGMMQAGHFILVSIVGPSTALILAGTAATGFAFFQYRLDQLQLVERLGAYLPTDVASRIARGLGLGSVDMSERSGVVVSIDLRNFDRWSEKLEANLTAAMLHHYTCMVAERVINSQGQVLQVNGTHVRAMWPASANAQTIIATCGLLLKEAETVFPDLEIDPELPPMALMIGIEEGKILIGTYGSEASRGFTLVGDVPRLVRGLVRLSTELASPCVIGPVFAARLGDRQTRSLGTFLLEESVTPRELFEIQDESLI